MKVLAEYIWLDGNQPTQELRSKTKVVEIDVYPKSEFDGIFGKEVLIERRVMSLENYPQWGFDGSSTNQATGEDSDCILNPVFICKDPTRENSVLIMCEVLNTDGSAHITNHRQALVEAAEAYKEQEAWYGIEQEYFMLNDQGIALGWPGGNHEPRPQGPYYCSVGADRAYGREVAEAHMKACLEANLEICGINAEVAPGQWEFQIGPLSPLETADQLWIARYLLNKIAESYDITIALDPKPYKGSWNGSGAHTNFSTKAMREDGGIEAIKKACEKLSKKHDLHMENYGAGNQNRMTGEYETSDYNTFSYSVDSNRGHSIRVPVGTRNAGKGYMEDRRPSSNMDPYRVCCLILETVCGE